MPSSELFDERESDLDDDLWIDEDEELPESYRPAPRPPRRGSGRTVAATPPTRPEPRTPGNGHRPGEPGSVEVQATILTEDLDAGTEEHTAVIVDDHDGFVDHLDEHGDDHHDLDPYDDYDHDHDHGDDHDDGPDKLPRWVLVVGIVGLFIAVIVGSAMFWYQRQINPPGGLGAPVEVEIPRGASGGGIGNRLADEGVVRNGLLFNFWASRNKLGQIDAGVYVFNKNMSYDGARQVLEAGPARQLEGRGEIVKVLIPEGLTIARIEERLADTVPRFEVDDIKAALASGDVSSSLRPDGNDSWEGLLFPATYDLGPKTTIAEFLGTLSAEMENRVAGLDPDGAVKRINERYGLDLDVYDLLKVASLVQSEAGGAFEAPRIASVIYNRLEKDSTAWTLGIDASDEYGAALEDMTPAEYRETEGPYNLRRIAGLPPTPISAPGDYALQAAFEPEDTEFMYYVLEAEGVHVFVVTDAEFQAAKARCRAAGLGCG